MVKKTMDHHVLVNLALTTVVSASFDVWMSCGKFDTFALVINVLRDNWVPMHIIVGLFEVNETTRHSMAIQLQVLLDKFGILHRVIAFVKYEGTNLSAMAITLHSIIDCGPLNILKAYEGRCFGHVMSKACQYVTNDEKVFVWLINISVKKTQSGLQKNISWTKKSRKGRQEWEWTCSKSGM